ncbi:SDR family oxidoreductase [Bradyrhizobium sp.]|uniref:SDR family oxidoreductase n=1 Tax=Bradyrhizobium sp. TaxID=376 RepID=UPI004037A43A
MGSAAESAGPRNATMPAARRCWKQAWLAPALAGKGIRVNAVAPGPVWTPPIPSTMPDDAIKSFGEQTPMKRPGQPAELATAHVMLADPLSSYTSGTTIAVTGGKPFL